MKKASRWRRFWLGGLIGLVCGGCASTSVLNVNYELPPFAAARLDRTASLAFEDARRDGSFLTAAARSELEAFSNVFALSVARAGGQGALKGAYDARELFKELLRERLEHAGVRIAAPGAGVPEIRLVLKEFRLDYGDRKFSAATAYDVVILRAGENLGRQSVNGSAERLKIIARTDAEKTISDMLSETLNKLDVTALFSRAGI